MKEFPFCSVIVLNYYGENVLSGTLDSLLSLKYPKDKYEIIIVDNNSKDASHKIMADYQAQNKNIKTILLGENYGFSKGNNFGIKQAKGDYVALVNNDCVVMNDWLSELVKTAVKDPKIFAVNSKILIYSKFFNMKYRLNPKLVPVYSWVADTLEKERSQEKLNYLKTSRLPDKQTENGVCYESEVPYDPLGIEAVDLTMLFSSRGTQLEKKHLAELIKFDNPSIKIVGTKITGPEIEYTIKINVLDQGIKNDSIDKIQNAGIMVFQDGYGRDIGASVSSGRQYYERDQGQYEKERPVYAACGAAVLYSKKVLDKIGLLDESFFMYYEDVEICERARFAGFKTMYSPKAVVRHIHAASSKEWSSFFIYHVERGRLMHVFYNFPLSVFLKEYLFSCFYSLVAILVVLYRFRELSYKVKSRKKEGSEPVFVKRLQVLKSLFFFLGFLPVLLYKRFIFTSKLKDNAVIDNYLSIKRGDWYFS